MGTPRYKIGWTTDIQKRVDSLKTGCPYPIELVAWIETDEPEIEREVHAMYADHRVHGEWFELPLSAIDFLMYANENDITKAMTANALVSIAKHMTDESKVEEIRRIAVGVFDGSGA